MASVLYSFSGQNLSGNLADMRPYLSRLCAKHGLGELPAKKNFFLLLEEPEVRERKASSEVVWDGAPIISRLAKPAAMGGTPPAASSFLPRSSILAAEADKD